jgi:hypothetical protein
MSRLAALILVLWALVGVGEQIKPSIESNHERTAQGQR